MPLGGSTTAVTRSRFSTYEYCCKTFSGGVLSEVRARALLKNSLPEQANRPQAALKYTMADAPTSTTTKTSIKMAGSNTTRSALPVVVACISRMPTVAKYSLYNEAIHPMNGIQPTRLVTDE